MCSCKLVRCWLDCLFVWMLESLGCILYFWIKLMENLIVVWLNGLFIVVMILLKIILKYGIGFFCYVIDVF